MGEYAIRKRDGEEVKIGTCEDMYYIRYEDRFKVEPASNSLDCGKELNLFWRLPYPSEDHMNIGEYPDANKMSTLMKEGIHYNDADIITDECDHKDSIKLQALKNHDTGEGVVKVMPVIGCGKCGNIWRSDWPDIRDFVHGELQRRLDYIIGMEGMKMPKEKTVRSVVVDAIREQLDGSIIYPDSLEDMPKDVHAWIHGLAERIFETIGQTDCMDDVVGEY